MFPVVTRLLLVIMRLSSCNIQGSVNMVHEISQFDIPDRQLLANKVQPGVGMWMDIGEAKITRTIFGRTKVRVIREQDKKRRVWLLTAIVVMAIAAAAWQGWIAFQRMQSAAPPLSLSERIRVSAPVFQPENITPTPASGRGRQRTPTQIIIDNMTTRRPPAPQQPHDSKATGQMVAKPVAAQPLVASKPQTVKPQAVSPATNNNSAKNQTDMQQPPKLPAPIQPAAPTVATPSATQPAANRPAAVVPLAEPLIKENTSTLSPVGDNQPPGTVNAQP
jgi:hypothetical protein